jgi:UDPglucose 6-dehydrogenase
VKALNATAREARFPLEVLEAVDRANDQHKHVPFQKVRQLLGGSARGKTIALWGLAFKAQTDDMRESSALTFVADALADGATLRVHDPQAMDEARRRLGNTVTYVAHPYEALEGADALVVLTEWQEFRVLDHARAKQAMRRPVVVDARNLYDPARMRQAGFTYASIGRP